MYILDEVSGYWTSPTDSARITESTVDYACIRLGNESQRKYGVDVDNYFEISTGFTVGVPDWTGATMGATLHLTIKRGTESVWNFDLVNNKITY